MEGDKPNDLQPAVYNEIFYEGIKMPGIVLPYSLDQLKTFEVRPDDIWICTYPKSGTHFITEIVTLILGDGDPMKVNRFSAMSTVAMVKMDRSLTADPGGPPPTPFIELLKGAPSPRVILTHLPLQLLPPQLEKRGKVIYVARNPKDMLTSMMTFIEKTLPFPGGFDGMLGAFMTDELAYGPWYDHVMAFFNKRNEQNVLFLTYEEMKKDLRKSCEKVGQVLGHPLSGELLQKVVAGSDFDQMKKTYDKIEKESEHGEFLVKAGGQMSFMQKGKIGSWRDRFTVAQNEVFTAWYEGKFAGSELQFEFA